MKFSVRVLWLILFSIAAVMMLSCEQSTVDESQVVAALDTFENRLDWVHRRMAEESWTEAQGGTSDSLVFFERLYERLISDRELLLLLEEPSVKLSSDADSRRREIVLTLVRRGQVEGHGEVAELKRHVLSAFAALDETRQDQPVTRSALTRTFSQNRDRVEREMAYRTWCAMNADVAENVAKLIRLRNQVARKNGFNDYLGMVFNRSGFDKDDYRNLIQRVDSATAKLYGDILASQRRRLGVADLQIWDVTYAAGHPLPAVDRYFTPDSQKTSLTASFHDLGFDLAKLPIYVSYGSVSGLGAARTYVIEPTRSIRVRAEESPGLQTFRSRLAAMGRAVFHCYVAQDEPAFSRIINGGWERASEMLFEHLPDDRTWLRRYAGIPTTLIEEHQVLVREQRIIRLRQLLLDMHFEYEAYSDPNRDLNKLYWDLFEEHLQLPRQDGLKAWAGVEALVAAPITRQEELFAHIAAAQTRQFLRDSYGEIVGNPTVGAFLIQNYYRFGSRYPWRELLQRGTDRELSTDALFNELRL